MPVLLSVSMEAGESLAKLQGECLLDSDDVMGYVFHWCLIILPLHHEEGTHAVKGYC